MRSYVPLHAVLCEKNVISCDKRDSALDNYYIAALFNDPYVTLAFKQINNGICIYN